MSHIIYPNRYLIWTIAIVFIMALLLWGAIERFKIEEEISTQETVASSSISHNPIAGWNTYRNEEYGFEFKYQAHLFLSELNINSIFFVNLDRFDRTKDFEGHGTILPLFSVQAQNNGKSLASLKCTVTKNQLLSEILFNRCVTQNEVFRSSIIDLFATINNKDFVITFLESNEQEIQKILSTFKFIQ